MNPLTPIQRILGVKGSTSSVLVRSPDADPKSVDEVILRLDRIHLINIFGFTDAAFDFDPNFNLIVGRNGSGKSSLLQAIVGAIALPVNGVMQDGGYWIVRNLRNIRSLLREEGGRVRLDKCFPAQINAQGVIAKAERKWSLTRESESDIAGSRSSGIYELFEPSLSDFRSLLPVVAFYSSGRRWTGDEASAESAIAKVDSRASGYKDWAKASADMAGLQKWVTAKSLERLEYVSQSNFVQFGETFQNDELGIVNQAVALALPGSRGLRFDMRFRKMVVDWIDGDPTTFEDLSDGQRGICALVADIARRMCLLNPQAGADVARKTSGVVVIDELDMHLHPAWQRRIVKVLRDAFPRVQFFAATHSPLIIGEVPSSSILLLRRDGKSARPERSYGLDSNEVLEEVMGSSSRNDDVTSALTEIHHLLDSELLDSELLADAQNRLDALKADVGEIPEVIQLQSEIESLRILGGGDE